MRKLLFGVVVAAAASAGLAQADPVKIKLGHFASDTEETYTGVIKPWAEAVNAEAKGAIVIELFPNGALGRNLPQQAQLIDNGVQDIAFVVPGLSPGRFPDDFGFALPGLFKDMNESSVVFDNLVTGRKVRGYDNFFPVAEFGTAPFSIHLRKPISSLDGLKGLKIRAGNSVEADMLKELGAAPIVYSGQRNCRSRRPRDDRWDHCSAANHRAIRHRSGDELSPDGSAWLGAARRIDEPQGLRQSAASRSGRHPQI